MNEPLIAGVTVLALLPVVARGVDGWRWLLALTMTLLVCASSNIAPLVDASFHWRFVAVGALVVWGLCLPSGTKTSTDPWTRVFLAALWAIAGLATLSATWSVVPMETLPRGCALLLLAALVHLVIRRRWPDRDVMMADLRTIYVVLSLSTVVSLGYGISDGTLGSTISGSTRFEGVYSNPNMLGMVCALTIPLGWAAYRRSGRRADLLGTLPAAGLLVLSQSRTALVAVLLGALWVVLRHGLGPLLQLAAAAAGALLAAYLFNLLPAVLGSSWIQQFAGRFTGQNDLSNGRTDMWQATVDLWWQNRPALGFGYASRDDLSEIAQYDELLDVGVGVVHNSYLQLLLELGLAAAVPLVLLLLAAANAALRAPVRQANSGLVWLIVTGLLIQVTESAMFGTGQTYPYVFWLAVAAVLLHLPADHAAHVRQLRATRSREATGQRDLARLRSAPPSRATKALTRSRQAR
ncbi:O-antigen ligase family protein [Micromonospora sp. LOL_023]|uniref:O-antigen ligase family protein n=1 Tax=Micromonospora sp. LOL_023 TaxID=3345418 RepID=UPI003A8A4731